MTRRPAFVYAVLAACLLLAALGATWLSWSVAERDRSEWRAQRRALVEENVRLSLWRIDSEMATLIATENARPYFDYTAFRALNRVYAQIVDNVKPTDIVSPSPLLTARPKYVRLHFQFLEDGTASSPQVPAEAFVDQAKRLVGAGTLREAQASFEQLLRVASRDELDDRIEVVDQQNIARKPPPPEPVRKNMVRSRNSGEYWKRSQSLQQASTYNSYAPNQMDNPLIGRKGAVTERLLERSLAPMWIGSELLLVRRVVVGGRSYVQGVWLDWPTMQKALLESIEDLVPQAELAPLHEPPAMETANLVASLPLRLVTGPVSYRDASTSVSTLLSLAAVWFGFLLAGVALVALVIGAMSLSERRASFVSAVTHELRTPLTTFRMYTEMLSEGMVTDENKRRRYIDTLRREAVRLAHLVENVLAYSRIERGRDAAEPQPVAVDDLLERMLERLDDRAKQAEMEFVFTPPTQPMVVRAESAAVEQILFNLVDNACKYAKGDDRRIHLEVRRTNRRAQIVVWDHGQGIHGEERRSLFSPFSKSAQRAAMSAPGVGLGLALSKRLAEEMGGRLTYRETRHGGASFELSFPIF